ncbi:MAG TPA: ACP S-malonyltransferase [Thermoanaerobaculia bacterium]|nr:ACP S-malonyltransferase [Thermoanaerobaculia bacterium]
MQHELAYIFPGQGSQFAGMGKDIAERFPEARETFEAIDEALGFAISRLCFDGPEDELKLTANTQPAILAVSSAIDTVLAARGSRRPDIVAGHSLGEYSAIVCAGGLKAADAAKLVRSRGEFMQEAVPAGEGAMAALIGPSLEEVESICTEAAEGEVLSPANINAPGQIVIAGSRAAVERALEVAKARGVRKSVMLPVSAPFHCDLMAPAAERLGPLLEAAPFRDLLFPLMTNVDASPVGTDHAVRNALARQVVSPVRWIESIERMIEVGVKRFVEVGPGSVLAGLIRRINRDVETINVNNAESLESFLAR